MKKGYLIKYGEIGIKGNNRRLFENALIRNIREHMKRIDYECEITREDGRIYLLSDKRDDRVEEELSRIFGIIAFCPMIQVENADVEELIELVLEHTRKHVSGGSFKVKTTRARKNYPLSSMELNMLLGEKILDDMPSLHVDVHNPDTLVCVEIRSRINIFSKVIEGPKGMPTGTAGRSTLLLSGGIDSPVAGYMMGKRGVNLNAVYFHAPPFTSEQAREKVLKLADIVAQYVGKIRVYTVNFTAIQQYIYEKCPHDELTIIMRRYMMRIAEEVARQTHSNSLITGESLGQVASQTMEGLVCTDDVCTMPVFRPLIGLDKDEIVKLSKKIGTFETSILPFEDCCTIFVAKHPVTKPKLDRIKHSEAHLYEDIDRLYAEAIDTMTIYEASMYNDI